MLNNGTIQIRDAVSQIHQFFRYCGFVTEAAKTQLPRHPGRIMSFKSWVRHKDGL
jgi:hypothetical protein